MAAVVVAILRVVGGLVAIVLIKKLPRYILYDDSDSKHSNSGWRARCHCPYQKVAKVG